MAFTYNIQRLVHCREFSMVAKFINERHCI